MPGLQTTGLDSLWQVMALPRQTAPALRFTGSIFSGESSKFCSQGGQISHWGKGANGEYRRLLRNKTFPIRGFQIYDGPVRTARCSFEKFTLTADRYLSAIGFFMKNSWQISPQNNVSQIPTEKSLYIQARCPENLTLSIARAAFPSHPMQLRGESGGATFEQYQPVLVLQQDSVTQWDTKTPGDVILNPINFSR